MGQSTGPSLPEQTLDDERLLLHEFYHRINNEFTCAIGMVSIASARVVDEKAKAVLEAVRKLLQNYAQAHHVLQIPDSRNRVDVAAYLREVCQATHRARFEDSGIELLVTGQTVQMEADRCWRLGLIVSELVTNAAQHAFGEHRGVIRVELRSASPFVECRVTDNGAGMANARPGRGLNIVKALARGLEGTIDQYSGPQGTTCVVWFPLN
jgi:two-component sensor histidine kinase